jgi:hypothetical protein
MVSLTFTLARTVIDGALPAVSPQKFSAQISTVLISDASDAVWGGMPPEPAA